jgi:site-specific recombinase XerD
MFNQLLKSPYYIRRHQEAPLLQERLKYLKYWSDNGARRSTLLIIANYLIAIVKYLKLKHKNKISLSEIKKSAKKWAGRPYKRGKVKSTFSKKAEYYFIYYATHWLGMINFLKCQISKPNPYSNQILQYENYMRHERGLSEVTISRRVQFAKVFLNYIGKRKITLRRLKIEMVDRFFDMKRNIDKCGRTSMHTYIRMLRAFLNYAEQHSWCQKRLIDAIKIPRLYKEENIPYSPTWDEVKRLIATTEGDHPKNIRDRAILMLLAMYGLRCSEVAKLSLDDIDWDNKIIHLNRAKNAKSQRFPLSNTVGRAISRYLQEVRPNQCLNREMFISCIAPYQPLATTAISAMVHVRWKPLNVKIKYYGAHSLRHACATHLLNKGMSLKIIGDHLGHQNIDSTSVYAKVDLINLRKVADFEIGDLL